MNVLELLDRVEGGVNINEVYDRNDRTLMENLIYREAHSCDVSYRNAKGQSYLDVAKKLVFTGTCPISENLSLKMRYQLGL